jgi:O-antigen/teichoic acid export membrane protein
MLLKEIAKKSLYVLLIRILGVSVLFGFTLFLTNFFPAEDVGKYDFVRSVLNIVGGIALLGTNQSIIYYSGMLEAKNNLASIKPLYYKMLKLIILSSLLILLTFNFAFSEEFISMVFKKSDAYNLILKTFFALIFFTVTMLNIDTIRALQKTVISELFRNIFRYVPVLLGAILIYILEKTQLIVDVYLIGFLILCFMSTAYAFCLLRKKRFNKPPSFFFTYKEIFLASYPMAISAIAYFIMQGIDVLILTIYSSFESVAYYSVAVKLSTLTALSLLSVNIVVAPKIAEIYEKRKTDELQLLIKKSTRLIFVISIFLLSFIFLFSEHILSLFGPNYIVASAPLVILLSAQLYNSLSGPSAIYLNMTGKQRALNLILIIGLLTNIFLNLYLIPNYGMNGAAIATLVSLVLWNSMAAIYIYFKDSIKVFLN